MLSHAPAEMLDRPTEDDVAPRAAHLRFPCSQSQQRFWFEEQLHPGNPGLNVAVRWRLDGDVSTAELEYAWNLIVARHQVLRTSFEQLENEPLQVVEPQLRFTIPVVDVSALPADDATAEADRIADIEAHTPFDLATAPLIRVVRVQLSGQTSVLLVTAHHVICDGWSIGILAREMGEICAARRAGRAPQLPDLPIQYGDFAEWEREWLSTSDLSEETAYSKRLLDGYKQFELLPDRPRPAIQTSNGRIVSVLLSRELTNGLGAIARTSGCTTFMTSFAALLTLLHRYSGEEDIALGTQVVGRDQVELENLVGCFINTIALRADLSGDPTFTELLERVRDVVTETFEIRHFPLERLIEVVNPKRDLSRNALFSVNFIFQRSFIENEDYGAFSLVDLPSRSAGALYDLNFFMVERPEGWRASCEYNADLFQLETVTGMLARFENLLRSIVADPGQNISQLAILSPGDRQELVVERNRSEAEYPSDLTVPELFQAQAARTPDATAVVCGGRTLTYAEVDLASNRLAHELRQRGLAPGTRIGVFLNRSADLPIALLGILKSGSAYVPLDPAYPEERVTYIIENSQLAALVTRTTLRDDLQNAAVPLVLVDTLSAERAFEGPLEGTARPEDPAHLIYTSGSTGRPKGVVIPHRALVNLLWSIRNEPGLSPDDTLVAVTTISFDIAGLEMFLPLIVGAKLVIAQESEAVDGDALLELLRRSAATVMQATPVTWQLLVEAGWDGRPALKIFCGGEPIPRTLAEQLLERGSQLWNLYGPTETTIYSSGLRVESGEGPVLMGPPIANTQLYVLDGRRQLVPPGVPGELYIGGDGVALGYFGLPELTAERFVPDTFGRAAHAKLYRTGDLVRARSHGRMEYLGRTDHQIKLRGFRIELGEVEAVLRRDSDVAEAVVVAGEDAIGGKAILAYVVPKENVTEPVAWSDELRARVARVLPGYMLPALIVPLQTLPRTPNGKIDRRALPPPRKKLESVRVSNDPLTPTELRLSELVAELLGRDGLPPEADIFSLGFHSLLAVRLVSRIKRTLAVTLPIRTFFTHPTIREIAKEIDAIADGTRSAGPAQPVIMYNQGGKRTPFIYLHSDLLADGTYCLKIAATVGPSQPLYALAPHGSAGLPFLPPTIEAMARDYLPRVKAIQPHGPYRLGGFCVSGLVAYELARLLQKSGETVQDVVLINASALPRRAIPPLDWLVRAVGLNARITSNLRESLIHNIAQLHASLARGPRATIEFLSDRVEALVARAKGQEPTHAALPNAFAQPGATKTKSYFSQVVSALTYHPKPYAGKVSLVWSVDQPARRGDPSIGWNALAKSVRVTSISGGHVTVLNEHLDELARKIDQLLHD